MNVFVGSIWGAVPGYRSDGFRQGFDRLSPRGAIGSPTGRRQARPVGARLAGAISGVFMAQNELSDMPGNCAGQNADLTTALLDTLFDS